MRVEPSGGVTRTGPQTRLALGRSAGYRTGRALTRIGGALSGKVVRKALLPMQSDTPVVPRSGASNARIRAARRLDRTDVDQCSFESNATVRPPGGGGRVGGRRLRRVLARLAWFPPAADIEPCMRFSRTRLPDVLHRGAFSVPVATAGWVVARRWFR
jgi:hypothetical protein